MTKTLHKTTKNGLTYYHVMDEEWINGKPVRKYVGYLDKSPNSKNEIEPAGDREIHRTVGRGRAGNAARSGRLKSSGKLYEPDKCQTCVISSFSG